jgi:hypothetical protein
VATDGNLPEQSLLKDYGYYLCVYHGKGIITLEGGEKFDCLFEAGQLADGQVLLLCDFLPPLPTYLSISATKFEGTTSGGFRICATEAFSETSYLPDIPIDRSSGVRAAFHIHKIVIQIAEGGQSQSLHFGITNFEFIGTEPTRRSENSFYCILPLNLQNDSQVTKVLIKPLELYEKIMDRVQTLKNIEVTCEAIVDIIPDGDIAQVTEVVNDLCYIVSVARGTKVQWVYCDQYNLEGKIIKRTHSSRITKPYCPLKIIHPLAGGGKETKAFIEQTYPAYVNKRKRYNLDKGTIDAYLDAKAEADYLEMRGIKLAVAMEILKSVFIELLDVPMKGTILEEEKFKELSPGLCKEMDEFLQAEKIDRDSRKAMCNNKKVLELNRRSFAHFLKKLCRHIDLRIGEDDIKLFVQCRNKLVHDGRFYCAIATPDEQNECKPLPSKSHEYRFLVNFLDRVFLKLLGYNGPYIDWRIPSNPIHRDHV